MTTQVAQPRRKLHKALLRVDNGSPEELLVSCPSCKALDVIRLVDNSIIPTRKFFQKAGRVYHDCGSPSPCRFHVLHGTQTAPLRNRLSRTAAIRS
jgi:hypothetical protein